VVLAGRQMLIRGPGQSEPSVMGALRSATCSRHARLATSPAMARLFAPDYTLFEYRAHLGCMLGLFEPLERAAAHAAEVGQSLSALQRSKDLVDDLSTMGSSADEIDAFERCPYVPSLPTAGLRGYLYVTLGSMLGGEIIVKRLRSVFGNDASYRFYGGREPQSYESYWTSFCSDVEERGKEDVQMICATAVQVFDVYAAWLSEPLHRAGGLC
jgi:heme oxygenase (biliverdin-IX-beta and delta-forming)